MLTRLQISVEVDDPAAIQPQDLHFHACRWVEGDRANHRGSEKNFAITPLYQTQARGPAFELRLLGGDGRRVRERIVADVGANLRFGCQEGQIVSLPELVAVADYSALRNDALAAQRWRVVCFTPTLSRSGNDDLSFPHPALVVGVSKRWAALAPVPLDGDRAIPRLARLQIGEFSIESASMPLKRRPRHGFVGWFDLVAIGGAQEALERVDALLSFAEFGGLGSMTTYGFGTCAVERLE